MTRINLLPPSLLCDQHLLAEHRELTRIPNCVGKYNADKAPPDYVLGTGHVRFFLMRLAFLRKRYLALTSECWRRGFKAVNNWPENIQRGQNPSLDWWKDYEPTPAAMKANIERVALRMPPKPRFSGKYVGRDDAVSACLALLVKPATKQSNVTNKPVNPQEKQNGQSSSKISSKKRR